MSSYKTKQRGALLDFLKAHPDELFSVAQVADCLKDEKISKSALYRNLAELEADGEIRRHSKSGTREVYYQYINDVCCKNQLHLSCVKCEKTFHMNAVRANLLLRQMSFDEEFDIDKKLTVLYGVCKACR